MSSEHAGHDHTHGMARQTLRLAFFLSLLIVAAEVGGGLLAHSLALLSDAGHALTDIFALGLAWFATAQAERPANARKTFGYHRVGILAALLNAITLILVTIWILYEAVQRFQHPEPIEPVFMFASAGVGIAVNLFIGFGLNKEQENLNAKAAALHVFGDVGASAGVIVAGLVILLTGWTPMDPILSVGIAVLIALGAWRIVRETTDILLEATPIDVNLPALVADMNRVPEVADVHDVHVWSITSGMYALSAHVQTANLPLNECAPILLQLESMLHEKYRIGHSTLQFECDGHQGKCSELDGLYCQMQGTHDHEHA
ncbi:zinc transporter ZitB [Ktedonobacter sp. SOSP1-52]|uniref:cation diffusion facilitator family transporter n=1 Tax=Ktedonobacter sp. SOSP1-52 TaxID=2778366 RepID=UPI001915EC6D|nr:cation diffusion facilitator family transporter [Ktedonobacter sp. SOSP1-52]GHO68400.1 zinc transporter ZitB [Ktedonobacter sp. SOSP1-52]